MTVYQLQYPDISGQRVIFTALEDVLEDARMALESWAEAGEPLQVIITAQDMDETDVDALPEHDGW